jgi:hypothetical protein
MTRWSGWRWGLVVVLLVGVITRLGWLDLIEFKNDEAWALSVATSIARGQSHPLVGIGSSIGVPNAPFFVYLMAIPELFSHDPAFATGLIGLLGVAAIGVTYAFGRWLVDEIAGVVAALLFAVSPWAIVYSRKVWAQDALPMFVAIALFCFFAAHRNGRRFLIVPGLASLTLAEQLHPTAWSLVLPAGILIGASLVQDRACPRRTLRPLGLGLTVALLLESPFLIWQARNGWPLAGAARQLAGDPARLDLSAIHFAASVALGNGYPLLAPVADWWSVSRWIELGMLFGGFVVVAAGALAAPKRTVHVEASALAAWLAAPILAQTYHSVPVFPHYFIVLWPGPFLFMGFAVSALWRRVASRPRDRLTLAWPMAIREGAVVLAVGLPVGLGVVAFGDYVRTLDQGIVRPEFGVSLARQRELLAAATRIGVGGPVYFGSHDDLAPALSYLGDGKVRTFDDRIGLLLPAGTRAAAAVEADPTTAAGRLLRGLDLDPLESIRLPWDGSELIYPLLHGGGRPVEGFTSLAATFDDGIALSSYRVLATARPGVIVDVVFELKGSAPVGIPNEFSHLLDRNGNTVAQFDGPAYPDLHWRVGDSSLDEYVLPPPEAPGPYKLEFGLYDYPSMRRHPVTGPFVNRFGDALVLSLNDLASP